MGALLSARDKIVLGGKRETMVGEEEKKLVAYHESGHALAAWLLPHADPLDKVTIIPRGRSLGATEQIPEEERHNLSESYLRDRGKTLRGIEKRVEDLLERHREQLAALAESLFENETLEKDAIEALVAPAVRAATATDAA